MKKRLKSNKDKFFPVSIPFISKRNILAVNRTLKSGWISSNGPEINKFENELLNIKNNGNFELKKELITNENECIEKELKKLGYI